MRSVAESIRGTMRLIGAISRSVAVAVMMIAMLQGLSVAGQDSEKIVIGERFQLDSEILGERRTIEIHLPGDYQDSEEAYPLLVVLDGGRLFRYCASVFDLLAPYHLPQMIIVGLPNTDRDRDLDPLDKRQAEAGTGTRRFLQFLERELVPHIEEQYRALPYRILAGHSHAGLFTIYALIEEPDPFDAYIATSPSLSRPDRLEFVLNKLRASAAGSLSGKYLHFSVGGDEPEVLHSAIQKFDETLEARQEEKLQQHFDTFQGEGHVPAKGFYQGMRGLFPNWIPPLELFRSGGLEDVKRHYDGLSRKHGFRVSPPSAIMGTVGRRMLREENGSGAAQIFQHYVSLYPRSAYGHLALAEAYLKTDAIDRAIEAAKKALELEPDSERASKMLLELQARRRQ